MLSAISLGLLALAASSEVAASPEPMQIRPHKIDLQSRKTPKGHVSALRKRATAAIGVPLDDFFLGTDLQWFGNISGEHPGHSEYPGSTPDLMHHSGHTPAGCECRIRHRLAEPRVCQ